MNKIEHEYVICSGWPSCNRTKGYCSHADKHLPIKTECSRKTHCFFYFKNIVNCTPIKYNVIVEGDEIL